MIIRLGLMDEDERYSARLADYLGSRMDESIHFDMFLFSGLEDYKAFITNGGRLDIILATTTALDNSEEVAQHTVLAYLSEDITMVSYNGFDAICKYQKADNIFRAVQGLAAQLSKSGGRYDLGGKGRVILFAGAAGGMGCTTLAVGCAARLAQLGRRVVYLNFQESWHPSDYFKTYGASLSDVHYTYQEWLRMESGSDEDEKSMHRLQLRLKSMLAHDDATGVDCYGCFTLPVDGLDMTTDEVVGQIKALANQYDDCIVDMDGRFDEGLLSVLRLSAWMIVVSDGSSKGNFCTSRLLQSLKALNDSGDVLLNQETGVLYSRFGSNAQTIKDIPGFTRVLGKIPHYKGASARMIVQELVKCEAYRVLEGKGVLNDGREMG